MRKITCVFVALSLMFALTASSDFEAFEKAAKQWISSHPAAQNIANQQEITMNYFTDIASNLTCFYLIYQQAAENIQKAADEWAVDQSKLESVVLNLINVANPSLIVNAKGCANSDTLTNDEIKFENATRQVMTQNPLLKKFYDDFSDEIGFLTKGLLPTNHTCTETLNTYAESTYLSGVAQFANKVDAYSILAKSVYVESSSMTNAAQRCLTGADNKKFDSAFDYYFSKNPAQKAVYDRLDDQISSLTKILPHDEQCVKPIADKLTARLESAYTSFGSGVSTISELAPQFLYVYLPESISEAKACLTN